jgi:serine/threonine protein kinase
MSRFRIISQLGAGGFGEAFRAWDSQYGVPVVLKRPLAKHLQRPDVLARFDREINRLSELTHPHIVPIIDHGHDSNGLPYLAMRFLPAGSLADRKKPHPVSFLHRWLPSIAAALDYVHGRGIVHRDVKPANIFFDTESQAYLGDFGIAKVVDEDLAQESEHSLTSTGGEIGTYPYMGPEFFYKPRVLSGVYDQYALAVTVYEMICGRRPFSGDSGQLVVAHVTQAPPDVRRFSPSAPASLCDAILRALAKKPTERFPTCTDFAEAALQDVSRVSRDESFRRFLCPGCHRLVKVPTELSGRSCRCPDCSALLRVSEKLDALWLKQEDPSSVDAPPQSAKDFRSSGNVGLSAPDGATLQRWLRAQENASSVPGTAEDGPAEGLEQRPEPSVALTNEGDIGAAYRIYQEALQAPPSQEPPAQVGDAGPVVTNSSRATISSFPTRWKTLPPIAKVASVLVMLAVSYALLGRLSSRRSSSQPGTAPTGQQAAPANPTEGKGGLTAAAAIELIGSHEGPLSLANETTLTDETAAVLASYRGDIHLPNVTTITLRSAKALAAHDGWLGLNGVANLTAEQLQLLATHDGPVSLLGLASVPREALETAASADNLLIPLHLQPARANTATPPAE